MCSSLRVAYANCQYKKIKKAICLCVVENINWNEGITLAN